MNTDEIYEQYPLLAQVELEGKHRINQRKSVLRLAPKSAVGAEIGVFTGIFSEVLAQETKAKKLYLVDPWEKLHGKNYPNWGGYTAHVSLPTTVAKFAARSRAEAMPLECEVVEDFGVNWLRTQQPQSLDWVYLDANHSYESVLRDLESIDGRLKTNGTIMGDDCWVRDNMQHSDVFWAVHRFCDYHDYKVIHMDIHGQWAISRVSSPKLRKGHRR